MHSSEAAVTGSAAAARAAAIAQHSLLSYYLLLLNLLLLWRTLRTTRGSPADLSSATQRCCMACLKPTSDTSPGS